MPFRFSLQSRLKLRGVHHDLVAVAEGAIRRTAVDFRITEGLRSRERQAELFRAGASKTLHSRHLTGHAIDVVALVGGQVRWEFDLYRRIAEAMRDSADALQIPITWGACWREINRVKDLSGLVGDYVSECRAKGRRPLVDGPHFELPRDAYRP